MRGQNSPDPVVVAPLLECSPRTDSELTRCNRIIHLLLLSRLYVSAVGLISQNKSPLWWETYLNWENGVQQMKQQSLTVLGNLVRPKC